jgi:hypothetical protein
VRDSNREKTSNKGGLDKDISNYESKGNNNGEKGMDKLSIQILRSLVFAVGGFTLGFELNGEYGGIAGGVIGFLAPLLLWKQ